MLSPLFRKSRASARARWPTPAGWLVIRGLTRRDATRRGSPVDSHSRRRVDDAPRPYRRVVLVIVNRAGLGFSNFGEREREREERKRSDQKEK